MPPTRWRWRCATGGRRRCGRQPTAKRVSCPASPRPSPPPWHGNRAPDGGDMIGSVRGTVIERTPAGEALIEVAGVGYRVLVPSGALGALDPGVTTFLFTHLHVREDAMVL